MIGHSGLTGASKVNRHPFRPIDCGQRPPRFSQTSMACEWVCELAICVECIFVEFLFPEQCDGCARFACLPRPCLDGRNRNVYQNPALPLYLRFPPTFRNIVGSLLLSEPPSCTEKFQGIATNNYPYVSPLGQVAHLLSILFFVLAPVGLCMVLWLREIVVFVVDCSNMFPSL